YDRQMNVYKYLPDLASGNVGIGTKSPTSALQVNGTVAATVFSGSGASLTNIPSGALPTNNRVGSIGYVFDGAGSVLSTGRLAYYTVPFACTTSAWNITVDTGTATVDLWKVTTGTAIPTVANTIPGSAMPAISSGTAIHSTTLTSWITTVNANDIFGFYLNAVASAKGYPIL
ncbi:MAG: hypothetical protein C5B49_10000, partial [Bdellovibrio sp.]